jgi:triacylglycerol lipase
MKTVLLVHGLAEPAAAMNMLAASLKLQRYKALTFDYPSTKHSIEECTALHLAPAIEALANEPSLSIVTHSMGGIMLRYYLSRHRVENLERVVMLTPGHGGSRTMSALRHHPLFPVFMGPAGIQSGDDEYRFDKALGRYTGPELGIIAGCVSFDIIGSYVMPWPHDGKVKVSATHLEGMKDHIVLPVSHDSVLFDPLAIFQTSHFLKHGMFKASSFVRERQAA